MIGLRHCNVCRADYTPADNWWSGWMVSRGTTPGEFIRSSKVPRDVCPMCRSHKDNPGPLRYVWT